MTKHLLWKSLLLSLIAFSACRVSVAAVPATKNETVNIAFVLLSKAQLPNAEDISRAFDRFATSKEQKLRATGPEDGEILEFQLTPGGTAFVALMPLAVPNNEADEAAKFSVSAFGTGWKLTAHKAHLVVTLQDEKPSSIVETTSRFTSLVAAVTQSASAVGVYWGAASATHSPRFFLSAAEDHDVASRIMLWIGLSVAHEKDGRLSLLSLGMNHFNLPDLLLIATKSTNNEALEVFFSFLTYVAERGERLPEGDTVGRSETERLPVHYVPSPIDKKVKVWRVELK